MFSINSLKEIDMQIFSLKLVIITKKKYIVYLTLKESRN